jgi:hypothetical protein
MSGPESGGLNRGIKFKQPLYTRRTIDYVARLKRAKAMAEALRVGNVVSSTRTLPPNQR